MRDRYAALLAGIHPGFFDQANIRAIPDGQVYEEMALPLADYDPAAVSVPVPEGASFSFYDGPWDELLRAVESVGPYWVPCYDRKNRVYCGFYQGRIASFCLVEEMGTHTVDGKALRVAGPGCVGTVPEFRRRGIGLKMVADVTAILKREGYDVSYIHYTGVARWYAKLGYRTCLRWTCRGPLPETV